MLIKLFEDYPYTLLKATILDINKALDKQITLAINYYKNQYNLKINSTERNTLREKGYYDFLNSTEQGNPNNIDDKFIEICAFYINNDLIEEKFSDSVTYLEERIANSSKDKTNILSSIETRLQNKLSGEDTSVINKEFREYIKKKEENLTQFFVYDMKPTGDSYLDFQQITNFLNNIYDKLVNFQNVAIIFQDDEDKKFTWNTIANTAIFAENFKSRNDFPPFIRKKNKQEKILIDFLYNNTNLNINEKNRNAIEEIVSNFYEEQSYGYYFSDLFINQHLNSKILVLQKAEYDPIPVPCPDCLDKNPRGNSYSKVMLKSFECSNPNCKSRSKSGRGKRYNYLSAKLQNKKNFIQESDIVPKKTHKKFRRDIVNISENLIPELISLYSFNKDNIVIYSDRISNSDKNIRGRKINYLNIINTTHNFTLSNLKIYTLLKKIIPFIKTNSKTISLNNEQIAIKNEDSSKYLSKLKKDEISYAVTSPPYYNAREYSQWPNLLTYLIDMMINSYHIYNTINKDGVYLYNIGDIVDQDNIYIPSSMSKRKQIIGLYSILLFELVGWNTSGNIVWDKGEVQSKRNSSSDLLPYYVKPINCYEHIWVFSKSKKDEEINRIRSFSPVIKIRKNGTNVAKHTAPFPLDLVNLLEQFIDNKTGRILDPYLGSGTTALWALRNNYKCLGVELNKTYYELSLERINEQYYNISLF